MATAYCLTRRGRIVCAAAVGLAFIIAILTLVRAASDDERYGAINVSTHPYAGTAITVTVGTNLRLSPHVIGPPAGDNSCATDHGAFTAMPTMQTEDTGDPNGPWYGFRLTDLPAEIQSSCRARQIVWVSQPGMGAP
jgi:hypothetical protein